MEAMNEFGFDGEDGFIRMQVALSEHVADESVSYHNMSATMALFRHVGIQIPTA